MYYMIRKFEKINSELAYRDIGYLDNTETMEAFRLLHSHNFTTWVESNLDKKQTDYFDIYEPFYGINSVDYLPIGLSLITDISNPEGV